MKHEFTIEIETDTCIKGKEIIQRVVLLNAKVADGNELARRVCDTSEAELRGALIKLGWAPPEEDTSQASNPLKAKLPR